LKSRISVKLGTALILSLAIICVIPSVIIAQEKKSEPYSGIIKLDKYHSDFEVNPDGSYKLVREIVHSVLTEEGVKTANQASLHYSTSLDEIEILYACTIKKDGRRIDVPPANIQDRDAVAGGNPMFSDIKAKAIIFPDVAVGDKVAFSFKYIRKTPLFPGHFSSSEVFSKFMVYDDVKISVSVPVGTLPLRMFSHGVNGGKIEDKDGRSRWLWTFENKEIAVPEIASVSPMDYGPRVIISSFKDYGAIAGAYDDRAKPKARVSENIKALATELTRGVTSERDKAESICTWVSQNVKFAGNFMGVGSVVPHDVDEILANKLGDCKDHATLVQASLAAVGIESTPVLINSGSSYKLPEVADPQAMNHIISYIPSLDLYVDSSSEFVPFGQLPLSLHAKPVVHTANFSGIRQTPQLNYKAQTSTMKMVFNVNEDGSADGEVNNKESGISATMVRQAMAQVQPNMEDLFVRRILELRTYTGTGSITKGDPWQPSETYEYGMKFHINAAFNLLGPEAFYILPVFPSAGSIASNLSGLNLPERTLDYVCSGNISTEEYVFNFPKNVKVVSVPKDKHLNQDRVSYDAVYRREGNTVTIVRKLEDRMDKRVCSPEEDRDYRAIGREILKDIKAQVIFEPADGVQ